MKPVKVLITGTYDNKETEVEDDPDAESSTEFEMCDHGVATYVSVYLLDEHGNAEPVSDHRLEPDPAKAKVDAMFSATEQSQIHGVDILNRFFKAVVKVPPVPSATPVGEMISNDGDIYWADKAPPMGAKLYTSPLSPEKYDDTLLPFLALMRKELHANAGKGDREGWLSMQPWECLLELYHHMGKLQKAVKDRSAEGIREYAADVANLCMMMVDVSGVLVQPAKCQNCGATTGEACHAAGCDHLEAGNGEPAPDLCQDEGCPHHGTDHVCLPKRDGNPECKHERMLPLFKHGEVIDYLCADCTHRMGGPLKTFTVFCREANNAGTTWIGAVEAVDMDQAGELGAEACVADWWREGSDLTVDNIAILGVAEGDVKILAWNDAE